MAGKRKRSSSHGDDACTYDGAHQHALISALTASQKSAAPLRRVLSNRGVLPSILLVSSKTEESAAATALISALTSVPAVCIAQLLSILYDEVKSGRNIEAILRFVCHMISLRYGPADQKRVVIGNDDDGWIPCLSFMIAHDALLDRVGKLRSRDDDGGDSGCNMLDRIVSYSIQLVQQVRYFDTKVVEKEATSLIERCFASQLAQFDCIVTVLENERKSQSQVGSSDASQAQEQSIDTISAGNTKDWWEGVELPSSDEDNDNEREAEDNLLNEKEGQENAASQQIQTGEDVATNDEDVAASAADNDDADEWSAIEKAAIELRADLIEVSPGATSSNIQSYADKISDLIRRAGSERGASGVEHVGTILADGSAAASGHTSNVQSFVPLPDVLIQQLTKTFIDGSTSAIRAAAYVQSFVLPVVLQIGGEAGDGKKKVAASRILSSTLTNLTKERPIESVEALFLPLLCGRGDIEPNQAQCELVSRVVKSSQLPQNAIGKLVEGLVGNTSRDEGKGMPWTEFSMPVLTALLTKKPAFANVVVKDLSITIEQNVAERCKSMKLSTLFHTFVTKYGGQIKEAGCIDVLLQAARQLKTFMGKSINTALKKLTKGK